jgi:hypothetical protein
MKKFDEFINEEKEFHYMDYMEIKDYITGVLRKTLGDIEVGNEGTTVISAGSRQEIDGIGKQSDFELENGSFSHIIIGIRLFYRNGDFIGKFNTMSDLGRHIVRVEDTIKETFKVEVVCNDGGDYFYYLIPITDEIRNATKSTEGVEKFNL